MFRTYAVSNDANRPRRYYVKIVNGTVSQYKGVQIDVVVDGISIKALAQSEDDRLAYMPQARLYNNSISISCSQDYIISGVVVEQCACTRQMSYEVKDLAYIQDINALNKKIDVLAEITHSNDVDMLTIADAYTTVQEVNDVLTNYVQKKDLTTSCWHE